MWDSDGEGQTPNDDDDDFVTVTDASSLDDDETDDDTARSSSLSLATRIRNPSPPADPNRALRIMNHAGRILWKAALLSSSSGGSDDYKSLSSGLLKRLFRRSISRHLPPTTAAAAAVSSTTTNVGEEIPTRDHDDDDGASMEIDRHAFSDSAGSKRNASNMAGAEGLRSFFRCLPLVGDADEAEHDRLDDPRPRKRQRSNHQWDASNRFLYSNYC
jgi:hypothetical protein